MKIEYFDILVKEGENEKLLRTYDTQTHGAQAGKIAKDFAASNPLYRLVPREASGKDAEESVAAQPERKEEATSAVETEIESYDQLSVADLKAECRARGIKVPATAKKPALVKLLDEDDANSGRSSQ